jgi:hypothetical protein
MTIWGGAVFVRTLQLHYDLAAAVTFEPFVRDGRPGDVAAELLEFQTLIGAPAHRRMGVPKGPSVAPLFEDVLLPQLPRLLHAPLIRRVCPFRLAGGEILH